MIFRDRATYNASLGSPVSYIVASPSDAPASLTFGPSYMELAGKYAGNITIGMTFPIRRDLGSL